MAKARKKTEQPTVRTGHRHVVTAETPRPAPNQSMAVGSVTTENPRPAPNQSAPAVGVVNADRPVAAVAQSMPVSAPAKTQAEEPVEPAEDTAE